MALYKEIELDNGVVAKYWHITRVEVLKDQPMAWVQLYAFISEKARFDGKNPCYNEMVEVVLDNLTDYSKDGIYAAVYQWLKTENHKFEGAEDLLVDPELPEIEEDIPTTIPEL